MAHSIVRAILVPDIVELICDKFGVSEDVALDMFYTSATGESFGDDETGLYGQSALNVFGLFCEEMAQRHERNLALAPIHHQPCDL